MRPATVFADRAAAGRALAAELRRLLPAEERQGALVLALPRGGVPVGRAVADELGADLDVLLVRKIGAPGHRELGIGAIGEGGLELLDEARARRVGATSTAIARILEEERAELARRARRYRGDRPPASPEGRTVIVVDDGVATGVSAEAALRVVRGSRPARLVLAVPVGPPTSLDRLAPLVDDVCCPSRPVGFRAVGQYYRDFAQVGDDEVIAALTR